MGLLGESECERIAPDVQDLGTVRLEHIVLYCTIHIPLYE